MSERIWTISNLLSFSRIILAIPISLLLLSNEVTSKFYAVGLILIAAFTDLFDGIIARKLNQVTEFGKILDPLADKIAIAIFALILTQHGKLPLWFFLIVVIRDVLIFTGGMYIKKTKGIVLQSNLIGKWSVTSVAFLILFTVLDIPEIFLVKQIFLFLSTAMLWLSFIVYLKRFVNTISNPQSPIRNPQS